MHEGQHIDGDQGSFTDQFERLGLVEEVGVDFHERSWGFREIRKIYKSGIKWAKLKMDFWKGLFIKKFRL